MPITIIAVGKKHEPWLLEAVQRYEKRLRKPFTIEWVLLQNSAQKGYVAAENESQRILKKLGDSYVVLLDERGELFDSLTLAKKFTIPLEQSRHIVLIVGGAYGVSDTLRKRADMIWSLSPLVFPHQLVRLLLVEQLYRSQTICSDQPYHNL